MSSFIKKFNFRVRRGGVDGICWITFMSHKFQVKSYYEVIILPMGSPFTWKSILRVKAPSRVCVWMAILGIVRTLDNLRKQYMIVVSWCCMCTRNEESIDHLLLHFDVVRDLWCLIF